MLIIPCIMHMFFIGTMKANRFINYGVTYTIKETFVNIVAVTVLYKSFLYYLPIQTLKGCKNLNFKVYVKY